MDLIKEGRGNDKKLHFLIRKDGWNEDMIHSAS